MVNLTVGSSSSPVPSAINQHTGLVTAQANEEGCNDDPPPIPQPLAGNGRSPDHPEPRHIPARGAPFDDDVTARSARYPPGNSATTEFGVKVYDYGAQPHDGGSLSTTSTATSFRASSVSSDNSSFTAVDPLTDETTVEILGDVYDGKNPHIVDAQDVATALDVDFELGLDTTDAKNRLERDGPNKLTGDGGITWYGVLIRQVSNSLTLVLVIAMCASYGMLDYIEGSVIAAVICLNIVIGFVQDYRAEKTMQSLNSLSAPIATVIRDKGNIGKIKAEELVVGDVVKIHVGDVVPADLRIFEAMNLEVNEALLTGESLPIAKNPAYVVSDSSCPIGDRQNMAWASSTVSKGRGLGVVVATGMNTEVGSIAVLLRGKKEMEGTRFQRLVRKAKDSIKNILGLVGTPLQVKLSKFALVLFGLAILLAVIVFSASKWLINDANLIYGICVAVAVIPESLIAVLTITMAVGTKTMAKGHVIVRKMQALEAVGGVTNICSDKTGTLTQGKMVARKAIIPSLGELRVDNVDSPFDPTSGTVYLGDTSVDGSLITRSPALEQFLEAIAMCNLSSVSRNNDTNISSEKPTRQWTASGEPTEISLQVFAMRFGKGRQDLMASGDWELLAEHPFDSSIKRMSIVYHQRGRDTVEAFMKGAGEVIVPTLTLSLSQKAEIMSTIDRLAGEGLRVLCVAHKRLDRSDASNRVVVEQDMDFLGLIGLYDPPRPETADAVRRCKQAGIEVHMLTGDHIRTATAIAHEVGILAPAMPSALAATMVMTANTFDALSDAEVDALPELPKVIARCSPATKVRMVDALHRRKAFCVMTGDGVNDSPALACADVGIAMGLSGSDVAKDAADLVLTDDNFASIVVAVEEGRRLFDNIQKFIMHLLISNISQVVLLLVGLVFRDNNGVSVFPLSPLEILWANMITSSFLALGLGLEAAAPDIMKRPPRDVAVGVFTWEVIIDKTLYGITMGVLCLVSFIIVVFGANNGELGHDCNHAFNDSCTPVFKARATVFAVLSFLLLVTAWEVKHFSRSLFSMFPGKPWWWGFVENQFLMWAIVGGAVVTIPVVMVPELGEIVFKHSAIGWEWGVVVGAVVGYGCVVESWKGGKRWRRGRKGQGLEGGEV